MAKSVAMIITTPIPMVEHLKKHLAAAWEPSSIPYLGIKLTASVDQLYNGNYPPMYKKLKEDLSCWGWGNLSWLGCSEK